MVKRHNWHCERCGMACTVYKKGKHHRVLVCPHHGVIATNPLPGLVQGLIKGGLSAIPVVGGIASNLAGSIMESHGSTQAQTQSVPREHIKVREPVLVSI